MRIADPRLLWLLLAAPVVVRPMPLPLLSDGGFAQPAGPAGADCAHGRPGIGAAQGDACGPGRTGGGASGPGLGAAPGGWARTVGKATPALDLVVALDFSKSMLAKDIYPSRLERAKRELERLMDRLAGDRIGLVAFAGETLTYPPTTDYARSSSSGAT